MSLSHRAVLSQAMHRRSQTPLVIHSHSTSDTVLGAMGAMLFCSLHCWGFPGPEIPVHLQDCTHPCSGMSPWKWDQNQGWLHEKCYFLPDVSGGDPQIRGQWPTSGPLIIPYKMELVPTSLCYLGTQSWYTKVLGKPWYSSKEESPWLWGSPHRDP